MLTRHIFCQAELFMLLWVFPLKSVYRNDSVFIQKMNWFEWFPTAIVFPKLQPLMINWAFMDKITRQRANDIWGLSVREKQSHLLSIKKEHDLALEHLCLFGWTFYRHHPGSSTRLSIKCHVSHAFNWIGSKLMPICLY